VSRPALEVADIFRGHGAAWRKANAGHVSLGQLKVMSAIESCRTAALGGHVARCEKCSHTLIAYNSCRNRHCPKCQGAAAREWLAEREAELLPVPYYHVVFTLPAAIADIAYQNKAVIYDLLFKASSETMLTIATDPKRLGARIGVLSVLHTWGSAMTHHPHVHMIVPGAGVEDLDLQADGASSPFHVSQRSFGIGSIGRIDEHCHTSHAGHQLTQEFQPLCHQLTTENIDTRRVAARSGEGGDKAELNRVFVDAEDDGYRRSCRLGRQRRRGTYGRGNHGDLSASQFERERRQLIIETLRRAIFDRHVLALNIAGVFEALTKCAQRLRIRLGRCGDEDPDHRHCRLLRARRERPRGGSSAGKRDERAPPHHSITSSA
jgi:hypothetical protein